MCAVAVREEDKKGDLKIITTGNEELDNRLGGGIPIPALLLIEGDHGTGKSVLVQQITYGALKEGLRVYYVTTESTVRELLFQAKRLSFDMTEPFLKGLLRIYPVHMEGVRWAKNVAKLLLPVVGKFMSLTKDEWDVFVVDSFSVLSVYADVSAILDILTQMRTLVSQGKVILLTLHPEALAEEVIVRARSMCDGYIRLKMYEVGGRLIKAMEIIKLRGALGPVDNTIAFDIDPAFGIKVIPLSLANA
ncbi:MAG: flagellar accessory protein FlaH [Thermoprotei archaeon]|nr:MAG: flagellar accessory protein FlaH [Thermoprotei archaeon]